jgi:prevent-host-death family protein
MKTMPISTFKAKCIGVLKQVDSSREPLTVTLRGAPLATIVPATVSGSPHLYEMDGCLTVKEGVDIVHGDFESEWEMEQ